MGFLDRFFNRAEAEDGLLCIDPDPSFQVGQIARIGVLVEMKDVETVADFRQAQSVAKSRVVQNSELWAAIVVENPSGKCVIAGGYTREPMMRSYSNFSGLDSCFAKPSGEFHEEGEIIGGQNAACVVMCELPEDMATFITQYGDDLFRKSATYLWNLVDKELNVDDASRHTVTLDKAMFAATPPSVTLVLDTSPRLVGQVTDVTKRSWREIIEIFRQVGIAEYMNPQ